MRARGATTPRRRPEQRSRLETLDQKIPVVSKEETRSPQSELAPPFIRRNEGGTLSFRLRFRPGLLISGFRKRLFVFVEFPINIIFERHVLA